MLRLTAVQLTALAAQKPPRKPVAASPAAGCVREIVFELPLPPVGCSPNQESSRHWGARAAAREQYRKECMSLFPTVNGVLFRQATISCEFFHGSAPGRYHGRDAQNCIGGIKALVDSLVSAGYLYDDSSKYLVWGETILRGARESAGRACVIVTLTRRETT